jgi:hypothetical protein
LLISSRDFGVVTREPLDEEIWRRHYTHFYFCHFEAIESNYVLFFTITLITMLRGHLFRPSVVASLCRASIYDWHKLNFHEGLYKMHLLIFILPAINHTEMANVLSSRVVMVWQQPLIMETQCKLQRCIFFITHQ